MVLGNTNIGSFPDEYRAIGNGFIHSPISLGPQSDIDPVTLGIGFVVLIGLVVQQFRTRHGRHA